MSEIALYNAFTKLELTYDEAKEAVADVASSKDMTTKVDIVRRIKNYSGIRNKANETDLCSGRDNSCRCRIND